jgi:hypothetical protein
MNASNQPDPGSKALEACGAQGDDLDRDGPRRFSDAMANGPPQEADPADKMLFWRLPSPLQLALLYRLHARAYRQPHDFRKAGRGSNR